MIISQIKHFTDKKTSKKYQGHIYLLQVYSVVDEMFLAGEIRETSQTKVLKQLLMLSSLEQFMYGIKTRKKNTQSAC